MENDEIKAAWQLLERRVQQQMIWQTEQRNERQLARARRSIWPLYVGQLLQILFGIGLLALGVAVWPSHRREPLIFAQGLLVHLYGVLLIAGGGSAWGLLAGIDYAAPVVEIQARLGRARRFFVVAGMVLGWSWWLLWIPVLGPRRWWSASTSGTTRRRHFHQRIRRRDRPRRHGLALSLGARSAPAAPGASSTTPSPEQPAQRAEFCR